MATLAVFDNAIGWAHVRLRGGWKGVAGAAAAVVAVGAVGMALTTQASGGRTAGGYQGWVTALLAFQCLLLVIVAPARTRSAIRLDLASRVIESHRLMPVPAGEAIAGYITGPGAPAFAAAAATFLVGAYAAAGAGILVGRWALANALVACFGLFLSTVVAFFGFSGRLAAAGVYVAAAVISVSRGAAAELVPGALVFCGPFLRKTVFSMQAGADLPWVYAVSIAAQLAVGSLYFAAAARRYRRADALGFSPAMGLALLAAWVAASAVGVARWDAFSSDVFGPLRYAEQRTQLAASSAASMLVALVAVTAAARHDARPRAPRADGRRPRRQGGWVVGAALLVMLALTLVDPHDVQTSSRILRTAVIELSFFTTLYFLARTSYRAAPSTFGFGAAWVVVTWVLPPVAAVGIGIVSGWDGSAPSSNLMAAVAGFSPAAALVDAWQGVPSPHVVGIVVQVLCAALFAWLGSRPAKPQTPPRPTRAAA